ncbi:MAG: PQQ-binding-like beta-propeller repeat protein [Nitrososphaerales archaeon]
MTLRSSLPALIVILLLTLLPVMPSFQPAFGQSAQVTQLWSYQASNPIVSLKVSGDGKHVLVGTDNGSAYLLNMNGVPIEKFNPMASASAEGQSVVNVDLSYNASSSVAIKSLYNYAGLLLWEFAPGPGGYTVSISPDGSYFAASSDAGVEFLHAAGQTMSQVWSASYTHAVEENRALVTPDAGSVLVESEDSTLSLLSASDGLPKWSTTFGQPIIGFASSYDTNLVAVTLANGTVVYLNGAGSTTKSFAVPGAQISVVSVPSSSDLSYLSQNLAVPWAANYVLVGNDSGSIDLFSPSGTQISSVHVFTNPVQDVGVSANGEYIAVSSGKSLSFLQAPSFAEPVMPPQVQSFPVPFGQAQPSNLTQLVQAFDNLSAEYAALDQEYSQLASANSQLSSNQQTLAASYANLTSSYSKLSSDQASLASSYANQTKAYTGLASQYSALSSSFNGLSTEYTALSQSYSSLSSNYQHLSSQLSLYETFTYLLAAALVVVALVAFWLLRKRP